MFRVRPSMFHPTKQTVSVRLSLAAHPLVVVLAAVAIESKRIEEQRISLLRTVCDRGMDPRSINGHQREALVHKTQSTGEDRTVDGIWWW